MTVAGDFVSGSCETRTLVRRDQLRSLRKRKRNTELIPNISDGGYERFVIPNVGIYLRGTYTRTRGSCFKKHFFFFKKRKFFFVRKSDACLFNFSYFACWFSVFIERRSFEIKLIFSLQDKSWDENFSIKWKILEEFLSFWHFASETSQNWPFYSVDTPMARTPFRQSAPVTSDKAIVTAALSRRMCVHRNSQSSRTIDPRHIRHIALACVVETQRVHRKRNDVIAAIGRFNAKKIKARKKWQNTREFAISSRDRERLFANITDWEAERIEENVRELGSWNNSVCIWHSCTN